VVTPTDGSHDITTANDKAETDVFEITNAGSYALNIYTDLNTLIAASEGGVVTLRLKNKIDEANYVEIWKQTFTIGGDTTHPCCEVAMIHHHSKLTVQCSSDVAATRAIPYRYIMGDV
jgi:hypothetical protein